MGGHVERTGAVNLQRKWREEDDEEEDRDCDEKTSWKDTWKDWDGMESKSSK